MKYILFILALIVSTETAYNGCHCYSIGSDRYCNCSDGSHTHCYRLGNDTYCD